MLLRTLISCRTYLGQFLAILLGIILFLLVTFEVVHVLVRFAFDIGLIWHADVASILLPSLGWFGAAYLWLVREHLNVDVFNGKFESFRAWVLVISDVLMMIGTVWFLPKLLTTIAEYSVLSMPVLPLPVSVVYLPTFVAFVLMSMAATINVLEAACVALRPAKP